MKTQPEKPFNDAKLETMRNEQQERNESGPLLQPPSPARIREELQELVLRDLLGPAGGEEEELDESRVRDRYLLGQLMPPREQTSPEEMDALRTFEDDSKEEGSEESDASQIPSFAPSSIGMSFCVNREARELLVTARWGHYRRIYSPTLKNKEGNAKLVWRRIPRGGIPWTLQLRPESTQIWQPEPEEQPDVFIKAIMRADDDNWFVSLFLVNNQAEPKKRRDESYLFQPELCVEAAGGAPIFQRRISGRERHYGDEEKAMAMRYRHYVSFAVGHGVSVHADTLPGDPTCAVRLTTRVVPTYDVPMTEAPTPDEMPGLDSLALDMQELAETAPAELPRKLNPLTDAYERWIAAQEQRIADPSEGLEHYASAARQTLEQCRTALQRIRAGIQLLTEDARAAQAFAFMNRAMAMQRLHTLLVEERRNGRQTSIEELDLPYNHRWRPFQLAFILLNIPALTDLHHPDRADDSSAIADLLWFPTGGGKTEAYLGLTAYTLAIRRLQGEIAGRSGQEGVAVLMRYTLRLLTVQQFQRAAALICACEVLRRADPGAWGKTPFRLGLWVGMRTTPNTTKESAEALKQDHSIFSGQFAGVGSPHQLLNCPWCGELINPSANISVELPPRERGRTLIYCGDPYGRCPFSRKQAEGEGLPVLVVDEEIYRLLPALLIATVDKFAQLPWKGETQMLFGQVEKQCSRHGFRAADLDDSDSHTAFRHLPRATSYPHPPLRPPDLIIQDELHLISGPLGSLVGLYESVIDHLATWEVNGRRVRPKVIAATATIRRAAQQIEALFLRKVQIFPPQGLDAGDSFFARQREPSEQTPGRRYLGICANGRRLKAALIRVYVAFLSAAQALYNKYGAAADPWMTLVGYFNTISELGGMRRLVDDDVKTRVYRMEERGLAQRRSPIVEELTSRKSSTEIPEVLSRLEQPFSSGKDRKHIDVLLATNMVSVGVDVRRLGLMVVTGQPKTTAEYIQATSRVGRVHPGLVCIVYNWARPRDLSHYEQFEHYHATFYQQVEALSVTPFAPRALDRGLAALLVSFMRLSSPDFSKNTAAGEVAARREDFDEAIDAIVRRAEGVVGEYQEEVENVRAALERLRDHWIEQAKQHMQLGYSKVQDSKTIPLLQDPESGDWQPFTCLHSLRDVEPTVNLVLDERDLGMPPGGSLPAPPTDTAAKEEQHS